MVRYIYNTSIPNMSWPAQADLAICRAGLWTKWSRKFCRRDGQVGQRVFGNFLQVPGGGPLQRPSDCAPYLAPFSELGVSNQCTGILHHI